MKYTYYIMILTDEGEKEGRSRFTMSALGPFHSEEEMEERLIEVANEFKSYPYPSVLALEENGCVSTIIYPKSFFEENENI